MGLVQKWPVSLLLFFFMLMAFWPITAAVSCFFLGLFLHVNRPLIFNFNKTDTQWLLFGLTGLLLIGLIPSIDPMQSLKSIGRMLPAVFAVYGVLQILLRLPVISSSQSSEDVFLASYKTLNQVGNLLSVSMIAFVGIIFIFQLSQLKDWAITHQNNITSLMLMLVCTQSALWFFSRRFRYVALALILCISTLLLEGRGAFIAELLVICFTVLYGYRLFEKRVLVMVSVLILSICGGLCLWFLIQMNGGLSHFSLNRFLSGRIELWQAAVEVFLHKPWFGIGFGTWQKSDWVNSLIPVFKNQPSPHNIALDLLSSVGVIGSLFFVVSVQLYVRLIRKIPLTLSPLYRFLGFLVLAATLVNSLVDFRVFATQFLGICAVALIFWQGGREQVLPIESIKE